MTNIFRHHKHTTLAKNRGLVLQPLEPIDVIRHLLHFFHTLSRNHSRPLGANKHQVQAKQYYDKQVVANQTFIVVRFILIFLVSTYLIQALSRHETKLPNIFRSQVLFFENGINYLLATCRNWFSSALDKYFT